MIVPEKAGWRKTLAGWAILLLPLLLLGAFVILPLVQNVWISTTDAGRGSFVMQPPRTVGMENYRKLVEEESIRNALVNTFFSPLLLVRILFLAAAPLGVAFLLAELRSGARVVVQTILCPLIIFAVAAAAVAFYYGYYNPSGGLAGLISGAPVQARSPLADIARFPTILHEILFAQGLAWSLPLGTALFLAAVRGTRLPVPGGDAAFRYLHSRIGRLAAAVLVAVAGFSLTGQETALPFHPLLGAGENLLSAFSILTFHYQLIGTGAAALQFLIAPLLLLGLGLMLIVEAPRKRISIRMTAAVGGPLVRGAAGKGARVAALILSGLAALAALAVLVLTVLLPWLGSLTGMAAPGAVADPELASATLASLFTTYGAALITSALCLVCTAAAGFALGYLRPKGGRAVLFVIGTLSFIGPSLLVIPFELFILRGLGALGSIWSLILPNLVSPLGIVVFTWFFRGLRDEQTGSAGEPIPPGSNSLARRLISSTALFSLPVFAVYFLCSLNQYLLPFTMVSSSDLDPLPMFTVRKIMASLNFLPGMGTLPWLAQLSQLQYILPLALLVVSVFVVFPRLALVTRKEGAEAAAPEGRMPETLEQPQGEEH